MAGTLCCGLSLRCIPLGHEAGQNLWCLVLGRIKARALDVSLQKNSVRDTVIGKRWICSCCRRHGRGRPEYPEGLDIIQYFPPKGQLIVFPDDCRGNIVGLDRAQEKSMKQEGRGQGTTFDRIT